MQKKLNFLKSNYNRYRKWSLPSKIGLWGFVIGVFALPPAISFYINYFNQDPKIIDIKPFVYEYEQKIDSGFKELNIITYKGIFIIVHIKSGSKELTLDSLKIKAPQYRLSKKQYLHLTLDKYVGKSLLEIEKDYNEKKPYINIDWEAYLSDKNIKTVLAPYDEAYVGFILLSPRIGGQSESGWSIPIDNYVGYLDGSQKPKVKRKYPDFDLFFRNVGATTTPRDLIINDDLNFYIKINNKEKLLDKKLFWGTDVVNKYEYELYPFDGMAKRFFAE